MQHGTVALRTVPVETRRQPRGESQSSKRYERIFDGYNTAGAYLDAFDEMFDGQGNVRGPYKGIYAELAPSDASDLKARAEALGRAFSDQGITFSLSGQERPFPLDLVPRVISAAEWTRLERGITQRVKALECYLDDVYGDQEILNDGVIPRRLVTSCEHFYRQAAGIVPPNGVRIHVAGIDLIRDEKGSFRVSGGQPAFAVGGVLCDGEPAHDGAGLSRTCSPPTGCARSTTMRRTCCAPCASRRPPTRPTRPSSC